MRMLERGKSQSTVVLFSDDDSRNPHADSLDCEWCDSKLEVTIDDIQLAEVPTDNGNAVPWLFVECGNCHRPVVICDDKLPQELLVETYILILYRLDCPGRRLVLRGSAP
ncbi:MAG: hypothetical protein WCT10_01435 [Patescibacteria group bacterium]|jgi:hypothetical protein